MTQLNKLSGMYHKKIWSSKHKILTLQCHAHHGVVILELFIFKYLGEINTKFENITTFKIRVLNSSETHSIKMNCWYTDECILCRACWSGYFPACWCWPSRSGSTSSSPGRANTHNTCNMPWILPPQSGGSVRIQILIFSVVDPIYLFRIRIQIRIQFSEIRIQA